MARPEGYTIEDEGAKRKWDAWKREQGLLRTEAKRQYILYLIDTMRVYASSTIEARELLAELEYLWNQIKDVDYLDEDDPRHKQQYPVAPALSIDPSDRYSTGTPWPAQSTYLALVVPNFQLQHQRSNLEQIYLHSRKGTQVSLSEYVRPQPQSTRSIRNLRQSVQLLPPRNQDENPQATMNEFREWQGEINSVVNKLSKEFKTRRLFGNPFHHHSESESEPETDAREVLKRRVIEFARRLGWHALNFLKNLLVSLVALLFLVWCVKRNVVVERTVVKQQLEGARRKKELVINMVINTDENKWFVRLLSLVNSFVGFV